MKPRRSHRQDSNHASIRQAFLDLGCTWMDTYQLGSGKPDGVVGYGGLSMCIEIKDPSKPRSKRKLTPDEEVWHRHWTGGMRIIETPEQCAEVVKVLEGWHRAIREGMI